MNAQLTLGRLEKVVQESNVSRLLPGKVVELHWCRSRRRRLRRLAAAATAAAAASADSSLPPRVHQRVLPRGHDFRHEENSSRCRSSVGGAAPLRLRRLLHQPTRAPAE